MDKVEEMWAALAAYQPQADAAGHGATWAAMCSSKTAYAAFADAAAYAAYYDDYAASYAADAAADAAYADANADADAAEKWAQRAIERINKATGGMFNAEAATELSAPKAATYDSLINSVKMQPAAQAEPVYVQVRHKTEYGISEWGVPLDPKEQHSTWADGVEMRLLYTTPPSTSMRNITEEFALQEKVSRLERQLATSIGGEVTDAEVEKACHTAYVQHGPKDMRSVLEQFVKSRAAIDAAIASTKPEATP